ncbi:Auxin-induced protein 5NG4 [Hordeum vulgare]|nr:Auxin-induced protein 5NG4 [Hordeum vulgare]KAE8814987.1 Auxin-induced protein 5NG4 [Hordeum vulgare]
MNYTGMTYRVPPTVPEMLYPPQVQVENTLRVWAISRWRGARALTEFFLSAGYRHLPKGSPVIFHVEELTNNGYPIGLIVRFTNSIDAYHLLGRVFGVDASLSHSQHTTSSWIWTTSSPTAACTLSRTAPTATTSEGGEDFALELGVPGGAMEEEEFI